MLITIRIVFLANSNDNNNNNNNNNNNVQLVSCLYFITLQVNINTTMKVVEIHFFGPFKIYVLLMLVLFSTYCFKCAQIS